MAFTLTQVRQRVGQLTQGPLYLVATSTSTGASATTFTDANNLVDAFSGSKYDGWYLLRLKAGIDAFDRVRRVAAHVGTTGTLTLSPALFGAAASAIESYELWVDRPDMVETIINTTLKSLRYPEEVLVAPTVDGDREISLAAQAWLAHPGQFVEVVERTGTEVGKYDYPRVEGVELLQVRDAFSLYAAGGFSSGRTYYLRGLRDRASVDGTLDADGNIGTTAPLELLAHAAAWELLRTNLDVSPDLKVWREEQKALIHNRLRSLSQRWRQRRPRSIMGPTEAWWGF